VNRVSRASRRRRNVLIHGTARVSVFSTAIVQSIYGAIQEYAAVERPEWVDGRLPSVPVLQVGNRISRASGGASTTDALQTQAIAEFASAR
jgi:hypothetical protein